jgi:hypothetical protein
MASGDLTDLATVQSWLDLSSPADGALLSALISAISAYVPSVLNRDVLSTQYVDVRVGNGKDRMLMRQQPITAVSLVEWPGMQISNQVDLMAQQSGVATDGRSILLINYRFPHGVPVRVTYTAGYTTVPLDIKQAVTELVGEEYARRQRIGEVSHSTGGQATVSFDQKAMGAHITDKLSNYIRVAPL